MHTENQILIRADLERIYSLAAAVEDWPRILPHYRSVRILSAEGNRRLVAMAARRDWIPVSWWAEQWLFPEVPWIAFRHVRGVTRGMAVEWTFTPTAEGVRVAISHELTLSWPVIGGFAAEHVIGPQFIANIAGKTLRRIKLIAEAQSPTPAGAGAPTASQPQGLHDEGTKDSRGEEERSGLGFVIPGALRALVVSRRMGSGEA